MIRNLQILNYRGSIYQCMFPVVGLTFITYLEIDFQSNMHMLMIYQNFFTSIYFIISIDIHTLPSVKCIIWSAICWFRKDDVIIW